jgi:hypothetical protein
LLSSHAKQAIHYRHGARFQTQKFTLDDAIGSHACLLEASMRVANGIISSRVFTPLTGCRHKLCRNALGGISCLDFASELNNAIAPIIANNEASIDYSMCKPLTNCLPGEYDAASTNTPEWQNENRSCIPCGELSYADADNINMAACTPQPACGAGTSFIDGGNQAVGSCAACDVGQYQDDVSHHEASCKTQLGCAPGEYYVDVSARRERVCATCASGTVLVLGQNVAALLVGLPTEMNLLFDLIRTIVPWILLYILCCSSPCRFAHVTEMDLELGSA